MKFTHQSFSFLNKQIAEKGAILFNVPKDNLYEFGVKTNLKYNGEKVYCSFTYTLLQNEHSCQL